MSLLFFIINFCLIFQNLYELKWKNIFDKTFQ